MLSTPINKRIYVETIKEIENSLNIILPSFYNDTLLNYPYDKNSFAVIREIIPRKTVLKRKTSGKKFRAAAKRVSQWCKKNRHLPVKEQHKVLSVKLRGHYNFYGITCNIRSLTRFKECVQLRWRKWLNRSQSLIWRGNSMLRRVPSAITKRKGCWRPNVGGNGVFIRRATGSRCR